MIKPDAIYGFSSTALLTLSKIYEDLRVYFFDVSMSGYPNQEHLTNVVDYLESHCGGEKINKATDP